MLQRLQFIYQPSSQQQQALSLFRLESGNMKKTISKMVTFQVRNSLTLMNNLQVQTSIAGKYTALITEYIDSRLPKVYH